MNKKSNNNLPLLNIYCLLLISLSAIAVYMNTLGSSFHFDDFFNIADNKKIRRLDNIPGFFTDIQGPLSNRPLTLATLALNFYLGKLNTLGYHLVNTVLHIVNSCLLFILVNTIQRQNNPEEDGSIFIPLAAALVFAVHPIQTEAVTYIISRSMLLATCLGFLAFLVYFKAVQKPEKNNFYSIVLMAISMAGVSSREDFVVIPVLIAIYDFVFIAEGDYKKINDRVMLHIGMYLPILFLFYVLASTDVFTTSAGFDVISLSPTEYLATQVHVHSTYLRLLMVPIGQNVDYDYTVVSGIPSFPRLFLYSGLWATGAYLVIKKRSLAGFSLLWFMVALMPSSSIVPLVDVIFEHRLYMASAGAFSLFAIAFTRVGRKLGVPRTALYMAMAVLIVVLSVMTIKRNHVWKDEITLWSDVILKSPEKARGFNELGLAYVNSKEYKRARDLFQRAIEIKPDYDLAHINLAVALAFNGMPSAAADECISAIRINPRLMIKCDVLAMTIELLSGSNIDAQRIRSEIENIRTGLEGQ